MSEELLLKKINLLPEEIIIIIKEYIPNFILVFLNKTNYILYHNLIKKKIIRKYESYIRDIIRRDNIFVFERIFHENYKIWLKNNSYKYKNIIYKNYLVFIIECCIENGSNRCRMLIDNFLKEHGLLENPHKKNIIKYIKWKN